MCPSLAESDWGGFPKNSVSNHELQAKAGVEPPFAGRYRPLSLREVALRKTICIWFGRIASPSAFVLFASGCVFRIAFQSFLDYKLQEFFMLLKWRTAVQSISSRFQYHSLLSFCRGQLSPAPLAKLSQLDRSCLWLVACSQFLLTNSNSLQQQPASSKLLGQPFPLVFVQSDSENSEPLSVSEHHKCL